jgi:polyphosphate kinase 2 (PPK2 family)
MGLCADAEYAALLQEAGIFERHLVQGGVRVVKFWFSVSRAQQRRRFRQRDRDPLKQWKLSPVDLASMDKWDDLTRAKGAMSVATDPHCAPWALGSTDCKKRARLNLMRHMLGRLPDPHKDERVVGEVDRLLVASAKDIHQLPVDAPHGRR